VAGVVAVDCAPLLWLWLVQWWAPRALLRALLALRRMCSLGFSRACSSFLRMLLCTVTRISRAVMLLSCEALAVDEDTVVLAGEVKCVWTPAGAAATFAHEVVAFEGDYPCC
jgi:hypothetical protein